MPRAAPPRRPAAREHGPDEADESEAAEEAGEANGGVARRAWPHDARENRRVPSTGAAGRESCRTTGAFAPCPYHRAMPDPDGLAARVDEMRRLAARAATIALSSFQKDGLSVEIKADTSPVTEADLAIEAMLRDEIRRAFPDDAILGEEHGDEPGTSGFRWILDPIDGTVSFANGVPLFATLLAIEACDPTRPDESEATEVLAGLASMPALGECVWAVRGGGAWWERTAPDGSTSRVPARVRPCASLADALVVTTGLEYFERTGRTDALVRLARAAGKIRGWSDGYGLVLVATGRADASVEPLMMPWDVAPFAVILPEAGGVCTDWRGRENARGGDAIAASASTAREITRVLE
jgi:histidinol-phosphatase